jgi:hypothetical protein
MLTTRHPPQRNILDLADPVQVKTVTRRLGISRAVLQVIVEKCGDSIAAISKEAASIRSEALRSK